MWQERECAETWMLAWAFVGLHQWEQVKSPHTATILMLPFLRHSLWTATGTVNSEWPACACHSSKAVTVGHISLWPSREVTHSNIPATHYHAHAKAQSSFQLLILPPPRPPWIVSTSAYTHTTTTNTSTQEMTPPWAWSECAFHTGGWPKQINQRHAS